MTTTSHQPDEQPPPYPAGLRLAGKRVVVVGGGHVAQRRIPALLASGAIITVVSPEVTPAIEGLSAGDEIVWERRGFAAGDLAGAWYALALSDDAETNAAVVAEADAQQTFCVRGDDAVAGTAWTPATGRFDELTVSVLANRDPRRSAGVRDALIHALRSGEVGAPHYRRRSPGVVLVGGGPGDPELITLAGRRALAEADVVVADRLAPRELLSELSSDVEVIDATKLPRGRAAQQDEINRVLVDRALAGNRVVRLKGGDPYVFGRGMEEQLACVRAGVECTVIPGITSAVAVPAAAGVPVTHRGVTHAFTVVSGHLPPGHPDSLVDWHALARTGGSVVLLMAVDNLAAITAAMTDAGRSEDTPVAVIQEGGMPTERRLRSTLGQVGVAVAEQGFRPPAVVVVGDVVAVLDGAAVDG
ncbi:uroporphyrinogen-III C-methyltransferase [Solicola gregarius]|uniref:uroporphyrinogen-III C-methyltransferase n=1 Tax=Solicola gregarius TaxID=2908642 RepID=A0AA46TGN6_9ACTN|nr:uroporphyrinogen-III C-methyltransferase [Solicola gregarius]UYM04981.1 uroporphyrinogen-III C-methyltransferase [Solicola gregarius]